MAVLTLPFHPPPIILALLKNVSFKIDGHAETDKLSIARTRRGPTRWDTVLSHLATLDRRSLGLRSGKTGLFCVVEGQSHASRQGFDVTLGLEAKQKRVLALVLRHHTARKRKKPRHERTRSRGEPHDLCSRWSSLPKMPPI